ncbi:MAG: class I SAM-dependent methyltransferase [Akkermansiaceae bacterium]|jgi:SAM-dependent methyltransferase|nr:class I SAM-dependent methyltransferase [Akkermansiaceae bacterium]
MNNDFDRPVIESSCALCGGSHAHLIERKDRSGHPLDVVICDHCGVVHNDPIPDAAELSRFYSMEYRLQYKNTHRPKLRHAARYFASVSQHLLEHWHLYRAPGAVLDVGSGSGEFLYLMRELGKSVHGIEPNEDYSVFCRQDLGLPITTGEIDTFQPAARFDHIRLSHVVEHLRDPAGCLREVSKWLNPGGHLYIEVPDFHTYGRNKRPGGMFHFGHIYNFDADSFDRLLGAAGLAVLHRSGPTSAFVTPSLRSGPVSPPAAPREEILGKIDFYRQHRHGLLRKNSLLRRLRHKIHKLVHEHRIILGRSDYAGIGSQSASLLKHRLTS